MRAGESWSGGAITYGFPVAAPAWPLLGEGKGFSVAGELHEVLGPGQTILEGDVNGDGKADFQIAFTGQITFAAADFIL